jgi:acyl dehydratase
MPLNRSFIGRALPVSPPYEVTLGKVQEFALAIGDQNPVYRDTEAAQAAGLAAVMAPPTFAYVVSFVARRALLDDPELGLVYGRAVHGEERFEYARPIFVGDRITARCTVTDISVRGSNEMLAWHEELRDETGHHVCTADGIIVSLDTATEAT